MKELLTGAGLLSLGFAFWAGIKGKHKFMVAAFMSVFGLLFFANLSEFAEFKASGTGFEARTHAVIQKAEVTIEQLRALAKMSAGMSVVLTERSGRFGVGFSRKERDSTRKSAADLLTRLGFGDKDKVEVLAEWKKWAAFDYVQQVIYSLPHGAQQDPATKPLFDKGPDSIPNPDSLERIIKAKGPLSLETQEFLTDYRYFLAHGEHRRPNIWFKGE